MSIKLHYLHTDTDSQTFSDSLHSISEEQSEELSPRCYDYGELIKKKGGTQT